MIEQVILYITYVNIVILFIIICYQYFLFFVYISFNKDNILTKIKDKRFLILIPAHNEERIISKTLKSILKIEYPQDKFRTIVIADNCSDKTTNIVKSMGFECIERLDNRKKGKGYALEWALKKLSNLEMDAIVIIDADSKLSRNILSVFDFYLNQGFRAIQSENLVSKKQSNVFASIYALGNVIKNCYVYYPKFRIGSSALLLGTGMCFHKRLIEKYFREEYSISEDIEFSLRLIKAGIRIAFAKEAYVETIFPENIRASSIQRIRWGSGTFQLLRKNIAYFFLNGLIARNPIYLDTALTLMSWSKPMIGIIIGLAITLSLFFDKSLFILASILAIFETVYIGLGIIPMLKRGYNCRNLIKAPILIPWFLLISILGLLGFRKNIWNRTSRQ